MSTNTTHHHLSPDTNINSVGVDGKPHADRQWMECFAQLVGTVLSLWEAAALDAAGENEEVIPTFLNLTDASIRMVCASWLSTLHRGFISLTETRRLTRYPRSPLIPRR